MEKIHTKNGDGVSAPRKFSTSLARRGSRLFQSRSPGQRTDHVLYSQTAATPALSAWGLLSAGSTVQGMREADRGRQRCGGYR